MTKMNFEKLILGQVKLNKKNKWKRIESQREKNILFFYIWPTLSSNLSY